jgi:hypothetical protein
MSLKDAKRIGISHCNCLYLKKKANSGDFNPKKSTIDKQKKLSTN